MFTQMEPLLVSSGHTLELLPLINPFTAMGDLIDFTLSNARRFYSSKGENLAVGMKGLIKLQINFCKGFNGSSVQPQQPLAG